jgi:hypothetical protein
MNLRADTADQYIPKGRHFSQNNYGTILNRTIALRQWSEDDVAFVHGLISASVYSGSSSP